MSRSHRLKRSFTDSAPTILVTVGAELVPAPWDDEHGGSPWIVERSHVCIRRRSPKGWGPITHVPCPGWRDVWDVIDAQGQKGKRVYVVCPRAGDYLTVLHFWDRVAQGEVTIWPGRGRKGDRTPADQTPTGGARHPLVISGRPDIVGYSHSGHAFRWVSVTNWCEVPLQTLIRESGVETATPVGECEEWESSARTPRELAEVCCRYTSDLLSWWLLQGAGTWRDTPGAAAWASFLRNGGDTHILKHTDELALRLEDRASFGARCGVWWLGDVGEPGRWPEMADAPPSANRGFPLTGPIHRYDVRAMYPTILRDERFPTRLIRVDVGASVRGLSDGLRGLLAIASVRVCPTLPLLPQHTRVVTRYPVGRFDTVLTTPELRQAIDRGWVERVWSVAWYTPGRPFQAWGTWGLELLSKTPKKEFPALNMMVKTLLVSLGGRLGRKKVGWHDSPHKPPHKWWGTWPDVDADTGEYEFYRSLGGHVQAMTRDKYRPGLLGACYAHLTAYGRTYMNTVREVCGSRQVLWQDTDGVFVTELGGQRLLRSPHFHQEEYGKLRYERTVHNARFFTPKHYWCDGSWVLAGVHDGFTIEGGKTAREVLTVNPVRSALSPDASAIYRMVRHIDVSRIEPGVEVGHDGWAVPPAVWVTGGPAPAPKGQLLLWPEDEA